MTLDTYHLPLVTHPLPLTTYNLPLTNCHLPLTYHIQYITVHIQSGPDDDSIPPRMPSPRPNKSCYVQYPLQISQFHGRATCLATSRCILRISRAKLISIANPPLCHSSRIPHTCHPTRPATWQTASSPDLPPRLSNWPLPRKPLFAAWSLSNSNISFTSGASLCPKGLSSLRSCLLRWILPRCSTPVSTAPNGRKRLTKRNDC